MLVKQHYDQGYIKAYRGLFTDLGKKVSMSKQTVSRRLKNSPFITPCYKKDELVGYAFISNNDLWKTLDYEPKKKSENNPKGNGFKNEIKLAKITADSKQELLTKIKYFEATRLNQRVAAKSLEDKVDLKDISRLSRTGVSIQLSGEALSKKLGYSSRMQGCRVLNEMKKKNLLCLERQKCKFVKACHIKEYKSDRLIEQKSGKYESKEFFIPTKGGFGKVFERQCNISTLSKDCFFYSSSPYITNKQEQPKINSAHQSEIDDLK